MFKIPFFNKKNTFKDEIAKMVNDEYKRRQNERLVFDLQWRLNGEMLNGNQYLEINMPLNKLVELPKTHYWQQREVFNQISTIYETRVARLTRQKPRQKVLPASSDEHDISSAIVTTHLMKSTWHDQKMDNLYNRFVPWLELHGTAFWKATWDIDKGRVIYREQIQDEQVEEIEEDPKQIKNEDEIDTDTEDFKEMFGAKERVVREGDIDTTIVPAHEIFPDSPFRDDLSEVQSLIHAKAFHIDEIEEKYGVRVEAEKVDAITLQDSYGSGGAGLNNTTFKYSTQSLKNHAVVKEYFEMPSKKYPKGRFIVVAGEKVLHMGPMPYMIGEDGEVSFPIVRTVSIDVPGQLFGDSVIKRLIPVQRSYNSLRNRIREYINKVGIGQWYNPIGALDDEVELSDEPGLLINYRPSQAGGHKPQPVEYKGLPNEFQEELATLRQEFTEISGVSELSRYSEAPSGVKSGVALSIANEQDDTRIGKTASNIAVGIVELGVIWVRLFRQFVNEPRVLRSVGATKEVEVRQWTKSDLTSDDIIIENISALSETPAQRRQMVFDLINTGVFNRPEKNPYTPEGIQKIFQMLELGNWESGVDSIDELQKQRAKRESMNMKDGKQVQIQDFDDHTIHIEQHNRTRMSTEYEAILNTPKGQMVDQMMRLHIMQHYQALIQKHQQTINADMQQQQMMQPQQQVIN